MAGIEGGYRPQNKEAPFNAGPPGGAAAGGNQYEQSEIHYGTSPIVKPEIRDGKPVSVTHLYMDRRGGQFRWWTERESLTTWGERVEDAHERGDPRYRSAAADHIPSTVAHTYDDGRSGDYISIHYSHEAPRQRQRGASAAAQPLQQVAEETQGERIETGRIVRITEEREEQSAHPSDTHSTIVRTELGEDERQERARYPFMGTLREAREYGRVDVGQPYERTEVDRARAVLQTIVNTHEDTINETTPIDRTAGITVEQVRRAVRVVSQAIIDEHAVESDFNELRGSTQLAKNTPQGIRGLTLPMKDETLVPGVTVSLVSHDTRTNILDNTYALEQPKRGLESLIGFCDYRLGGKHANLAQLRAQYYGYEGYEGSYLENTRIMWRGLRWMSANMLDWDNPDTILPEELDGDPQLRLNEPTKLR